MKFLDMIKKLLGDSEQGDFDDRMKMHGSLSGILQREDGSVETFTKDNIVVDVGFDFIADAIGNAAARPACMGYIGVGTGTVAPVSGNIQLGTELLRKAATYAHTVGTKVFTFTAVFNPGEATGAITEAGVLNAANNGIMLDRVTFPVVNKGANDTFTAVFTFTMS